MSNRRLEKKGRFAQIAPIIVSAVVIAVVISVFYVAGWFSLSSPGVHSASSRCRSAVCISDAIGACTSEGSDLVKIRGKIVRHEDECCDFYLGDDSGEILIQTDTLLPCKEGRVVTVYGRVVKRGLQHVITDSRIEFH